MIKINYTYSSNSGNSAKRFRINDAEELTVDKKVPNQARQIIQYACELAETKEDFTYADLADFIDTIHVGTFTTSKGGTMRIIRYYSKLLQETGILVEA